MSVLQTLPRFRNAAVVGEAKAAGTALRMGVSPHTRALAARQLGAAVAQGQVSARAARKAMCHGDIAVATLLRPHTIRLSAPQIDANTLRELPISGTLPIEMMNNLLDLARSLLRDGDLDIARLRELAHGTPDMVELVDVLQKAWQRRCERLTCAALPHRPADAYHCFMVTLTPILEAIRVLSNGAHGPLEQFDRGDVQGDGVVIELTDWPHVLLPAHPVREAEFFSAFIGVWQAIAQASGKPQLMYGIDPHLSCFGGSLAEAFEDAITTATWVDGVPHLTAAARDALQEEYDVEDPDQLTGELTRYRDWHEAVKRRGLSPNSQDFQRFVQNKATPEQARLLEKLRTLLQHLRQYRRKHPARAHVHYASAGDGPIEVALLPNDYGIDEYVGPWIEGLYESGETPLLCVTQHDAQNMDELLILADQATVSALVATYCLNEVADHVHEQRQRAAAHRPA